jgi:hypothetical protein
MFALEFYGTFQQLNLPANTDTFSFPSEDIIENWNKLNPLYNT